MALQFILALGFCYLLGSIPFGLLVGFLVAQRDVRTFGSGNIGATNVARMLGFRWGVLVFILDFLKGFFPLWLVSRFVAIPQENSFGFLLLALATICGHNWPVFLLFRGGKGVSTSLGAVVSLSLFFGALKIPVFIAVGAWIVFFVLTHVVAIASCVAAGLFCATCFFVHVDLPLQVFSCAVFLFIMIRHKKNFFPYSKRQKEQK